MPLVLTGDKGSKKFAIAMIFQENLADYLGLIHTGRGSHRRDFSHNLYHKSESLRSDVDEEDNLDVLNASMIQIVNDYIDQWEHRDHEKNKVLGDKEYYIPKALVLISDLPIFDILQEMLLKLYKQWTYRINYPVDSYLYYLTYEVPLPTLGTIVKMSLPNMMEIEISDYDYNIEYITTYFSNPLLTFPNFYKVLYWFLCQVGNTLLVSNNVTNLVMVSEVLRTIIYPFTYDDLYVPLLAPNMIKTIEAPFPWHLGWLVRSSFCLINLNIF